MSKYTERGQALLEHYARDINPENSDPEINFSTVSDVLSDLYHYCAANDIPWLGAVDLAEFNFEEEKP